MKTLFFYLFFLSMIWSVLNVKAMAQGQSSRNTQQTNSTTPKERFTKGGIMRMTPPVSNGSKKTVDSPSKSPEKVVVKGQRSKVDVGQRKRITTIQNSSENRAAVIAGLKEKMTYLKTQVATEDNLKEIEQIEKQIKLLTKK